MQSKIIRGARKANSNRNISIQVSPMFLSCDFTVADPKDLMKLVCLCQAKSKLKTD